MRQAMFILPETQLDEVQTLQDAGEPVLQFGPPHWIDPDGQRYTVSAGLLDLAWIAQVQDQTRKLFVLAPEATGADPGSILVIETDVPLHRLQALALTV